MKISVCFRPESVSSAGFQIYITFLLHTLVCTKCLWVNWKQKVRMRNRGSFRVSSSDTKRENKRNMLWCLGNITLKLGENVFFHVQALVVGIENLINCCLGLVSIQKEIRFQWNFQAK